MRPSARVRTCSWLPAESKRTNPLAVATSMVPSFGLGRMRFTQNTCSFSIVRGGPVIGLQSVEAAVEVADPETAFAVRGQRGNVAIAQYRCARTQDWLPAEAMGSHAI